MIVVDSSVWIANLRGHDSAAVRWLRNSEVDAGILVGDLVLLELLQGAVSDRQARMLRDDLRRYGTVQMLDERIAVHAAANFRRLRSRGVSVRKTIDLIIATFCIEGGHDLLHQDRDFAHFEVHLDLKVFRPH